MGLYCRALENKWIGRAWAVRTYRTKLPLLSGKQCFPFSDGRSFGFGNAPPPIAEMNSLLISYLQIRLCVFQQRSVAAETGPVRDFFPLRFGSVFAPV
ncbi:hypothetical protein BaRGS_00003362 [Batillaria attramentaria]|uniref:Uncharacterized protein n=1 Tax=Batillaria attramentaria TaxID=370345 RepID=A0ABD0M0Y8_9CAEN